MLHIEAEAVVAKLYDLYPGWNPTSTMLEAIKHKLTPFAPEAVEQAILDSYDPGKRTAPLEAILAAVRRAAADRAKRVQAAERMAAAPQRVVTTDEVNAMYVERARAQDAFAQAMCRRRGLDF
jgi:hypothetical protein